MTLPNPRFSQKTGPKLLGRLAHNSVLPREKGLREAIASAKLAARTPTSSTSVPAGLTAEERAIEGLDFTRWEAPAYQLRQDEYWIALDILNNSQVARASGMIYLFTQPELARAIEAFETVQMPLPEQVSSTLMGRTGDAARASTNVSAEQLRQVGHSKVAELIESRANGVVRQVVFAHLEHAHWTLHVHALDTMDNDVTTWNSLGSSSAVNIEDQMVIAAALRRHSQPTQTGTQEVCMNASMYLGRRVR